MHKNHTGFFKMRFNFGVFCLSDLNQQLITKLFKKIERNGEKERERLGKK
jgi:hypothetical protein